MMPEYSPLVVLFICIHLISIFLVSFLIYVILKTGPYITKWTLFQLCICLLILGLSSLPPIMIYGDSLKERALDSSLCIIQHKIIMFIYGPLKMFPAVLSVYLWFAVARFNYKLEQRYFWYLSGLIWVITIALNVFDLISNSKEENWGVRPGVLLCKSTPSKQVWLFYIIPTSIMTFMSMVMTAHSSFILWGRWRNFNQKKNRRTAIDLGYAVRLSVMSAFYSLMLLASIIPTVILAILKADHGFKNIVTFLDFASSFFGTILFMIFGTTKSAAIFLPCCYYAPPNDRVCRQEPTRSINQQYEISSPVELNVVFRPDGSDESNFQSFRPDGSGDESNFQSVSSRIILLDNS